VNGGVSRHKDNQTMRGFLPLILAGALGGCATTPTPSAPYGHDVNDPMFQFAGTWEGSLHCYNGPHFIDGEGAALTFRIAIQKSLDASVFEFVKGEWQEFKRGAFWTTQLGSQMIVNSLTSGPDEDGTWVEGSTFTLVHRDANTVIAYWLRTVNNLDIPPTDISFQFAWGCSGEMRMVESGG
jgi:hypothetical protein